VDDVPRYLPFEGPAFRLRVGLRPLDPATWLELDERYDADLAEKARLLRHHHHEVVAALPGTHAAAAELLSLVVDNLLAHHPGTVAMDGDDVVNLRTGERLPAGALHPVDAAGRLVQEDLVLLAEEAGEHRLVAASLCFPSRWRLADKVGLGMAAIHAPVPGYAEELARPTHGALARLTPERPVWRLNWSLHDDPALYQPQGHGEATPNPAITAANAGTTVWLRVERQTLRRLDGTGAIVFGIRTHQWPLASLAPRPAACAALAAHLRSTPPAFSAYKSLPSLAAPVLAWLDARS
jgi:dimethylamine monooxygenase subunit A